MDNKLNLEKKLSQLKPILEKKFGVDKIGYFGSFARSEQNKNSDIDILVSFNRPIGLEFLDLKDFLEEELQRNVDMVTERALKPQIKESILNEVIYQ
jgi:predicted nucleotidyltransferase